MKYHVDVNQTFERLRDVLGEQAGKAAIMVLLEELGGSRVTFPRFGDYGREHRDNRIRCLFDGANYNELALRFGLSATQVRRIVRNQ